MSPARTTRRPAAVLATGALLTSAGIAALAPSPVTASSHREAPAISGQPQYDNTDTYAFVSPDKPDTVTLVANWNPFEEPAGGPNFYPFANDALHEIHIDNDGDALGDVVYRWTFRSSYRNPNTFLYNTGPVTSLTDPDLNFRQSYDLSIYQNGAWKTLLRGVPVAPSYVGKASMPNYVGLHNAAVRNVPGGGKTFAGQADDPFFLDLRVFDLLYGGNLSEVGDDTLAGFNVNALAIQVPKFQVVDKDPVIGVWSTTSRRNSSGAYRQVSRLGGPLVNEVVIPVKDKDRFNASHPKDDAQFLKYVTSPELPKLVRAVYGDKVPPAPREPRNDLVSVFLTGVKGLNQPANVKPSEQLRLNTSIAPTANPKRLGVLEKDLAGFPNGRRLSDDVLDIALQAAQGELVGQPNDLGDAVNRNDKDFAATFPYVALPTSGSEASSRRGGTAALPAGGGSATTMPAAAPGVVPTPTAMPAVAPASAPAAEPVSPVVPTVLAGTGVLLLLLGGAIAVRRSRRNPRHAAF